jgi:hypothetical protein
MARQPSRAPAARSAGAPSRKLRRLSPTAATAKAATPAKGRAGESRKSQPPASRPTAPPTPLMAAAVAKPRSRSSSGSASTRRVW